MQKTLILIIIICVNFCNKSVAQADLLITPTRVVFEGNKQREELNLVNIGNDTAIYSISFLQYNQTEDGGYKIIQKPDSGQMFAEPYLRIYPRTVMLAPREPQVIALQCRRKPDMIAGEYRSHLYFRSERNYKPLGTKTEDTSKIISVKLIPIYGLSIPIIIRSGIVNAKAALSYLKLEIQQDTIPYLKLSILREGNISVFGNIIVEYYPVKGKPYEIGRLNSLSVYTNINQRNIEVKLNKTPGLSLENGKLKVKYSSTDLAKPVVYAEAELELR
jgi:hypothetical protein